MVKMLPDFSAVLIPFTLWFLEHLKETLRDSVSVHIVPSLAPPPHAWGSCSCLLSDPVFTVKVEKRCVSHLTPSSLLTCVSCHYPVRKSFFFFCVYIFSYHYQHGIRVSPFTGVAYIPVLIYFGAGIVPHSAMWVQAGLWVSGTRPLHFVQACPSFWNRFNHFFPSVHRPVRATARSCCRQPPPVCSVGGVPGKAEPSGAAVRSSTHTHSAK